MTAANWTAADLSQDAAHGALPTLYAATHEVPGNAFVGPNGFNHLRGHPELVQPSAASQDLTLAGKLWARSAELTGVGWAVPAQRVGAS